MITVLAFTDIGGLDILRAQEGRVFVHRYRQDEEYRIVGVNNQILSINGREVGTAEVLTRVLITVLDVDDDGAASESPATVGTIRARYQVSEESELEDHVFTLEREYEVEFSQDASGRQEVPRGSFVPQVRNIPVFPDRPIAPGDNWTAQAFEVYDLREGIGLQEPLVIPVEVQYTYTGQTEFEGRRYDVFAIAYNLFHRPAPDAPEAGAIRLMTARFSQELYWDYIAGRPHFYREDYNLFIQLADGTRSEYRGSADGKVVSAPPLDRNRLRDDIQQAIEDDGIRDTTVRSDDEGVVVSIENIRFAPDSAELLDSEREKLQWLARILSRHPDRDLLITGHTAMAGTVEGRMRLSQERATAVAEFLLSLGVRRRDGIMTQGRGAQEPIADNGTEEGRRRNRRVEITILEN